MTLRAVLVGCGNIGSRYDQRRPVSLPPLSHAGAYSAHPRYQLAGVVDMDEQRRYECQQRWSVPFASGSFEAAFEHVRPDVVSIATPPDIRLPVIEAAILAGTRAIFCEKPLAMTVAEGESIVQRCQAAGVILAVNYLRRWDPGCAKVHEALADGELGAILRVTGTYVRGLANNGGHLIDLVHWWSGQRLTAPVARRVAKDTADVTFATPGGIVVHLHELTHAAYDVFEMDLFAERGRVTLRDFGYSLWLQRATPSTVWPGFTVLTPAQAISTALDSTLPAALDDIARCLASSGQPRCDGSEALAVLSALASVPTVGAGC